VYVFDLVNKKRVKVLVEVASKKDLKPSKYFKFDWTKEQHYETYKLVIEETNEILGLISINSIFEELRIEIMLIEIHDKSIGKNKLYQRIAGILIAYACKISFDKGFFGFVSLIPKTKLIEHYKNKYGFNQFGRHLALELNSSESIMNKYLTNE